LVKKKYLLGDAIDIIYYYYFCVLFFHNSSNFFSTNFVIKLNLVDRFFYGALYNKVNAFFYHSNHPTKSSSFTPLYHARKVIQAYPLKRKDRKFTYRPYKHLNENTAKFSLNFFLLNAFFLSGHSILDCQTKLHHNFNLFGMFQLNTKLIIVEPKKFFKKWRDVFTLLANMNYFNHSPLIFTSSVLKKEALAVNWNFNPLEHDLWKLTSPIFFSKITTHTKRVSFFFKKLKEFRFNFVLVTDAEQHFKLLPYFNHYKWYSLALIPANIDPWSVSFAIPILQNNLNVQFFMLNFLIFTAKTAAYQKHLFCKNLWLNFCLTSKCKIKNIV
jgi:hypothetical protein